MKKASGLPHAPDKMKMPKTACLNVLLIHNAITLVSFRLFWYYLLLRVLLGWLFPCSPLALCPDFWGLNAMEGHSILGTIGSVIIRTCGPAVVPDKIYSHRVFAFESTIIHVTVMSESWRVPNIFGFRLSRTISRVCRTIRMCRSIKMRSLITVVIAMYLSWRHHIFCVRLSRVVPDMLGRWTLSTDTNAGSEMQLWDFLSKRSYPAFDGWAKCWHPWGDRGAHSCRCIPFVRYRKEVEY